jgi:hypothetical protein
MECGWTASGTEWRDDTLSDVCVYCVSLYGSCGLLLGGIFKERVVICDRMENTENFNNITTAMTASVV